MKRSTAFLLVLSIVLAMVVNSADFFFHRPFYETWDSAANALSVDRAKHFAQLYGPYSRWNFYHPGPALFYLQALGEWIFFDGLRLSPAPFNAQTLFYLFVTVGFFVAALQVFARYLPPGRWRWWFLCAALVAAALHFTAIQTLHSYDPVRGPNAFVSLWSAHALVLPFLCLLTAGASVAVGGGEDLPLLALVDGFLLQTHVAQPLFVFPLTILAYAGFLWRSGAGGGGWRPVWARWRAAWRTLRGEHLAAGVILGIFALPVAIDLTGGRHSNLAAIINHLHAYRGEHKTLKRAWWYFVQFGGYTPYQPDSIEFTKFFDRAGIIAYLRAHAALFGLWVGGALMALWAMSGAGRRPEAVADDGSTQKPAERRPVRQQFLAWASVFLLAAIILTLKWGTMQDGAMFYYNAWFNFAIYYFGGLIALAVGVGWVLAWCRASAAKPRWPERLAGLAVVAAVCIARREALRVSDPYPASTAAFHASVARALAATDSPTDDPPRLRMLHFPVGSWVTVAGVALQMERARQPFYVPDDMGVTFGGKHLWRAATSEMIRRQGLQSWQFDYLPEGPKLLPEGTEMLRIVTPRLNSLATGWGDFLWARLYVPFVDPNKPDQGRLDLRLGNGTKEFCVAGWGDPEPWGTWSGAHHALLEFRAAPIPTESAGVNLSLLSVISLLDPPRLTGQRLRMFFNAEPLGEERRLLGAYGAISERIPTARWNRAATAGGNITLELELPDATSPVALHPESPSHDLRTLGVGVGEITFQTVPPTPPPVQN